MTDKQEMMQQFDVTIMQMKALSKQLHQQIADEYEQVKKSGDGIHLAKLFIMVKRARDAVAEIEKDITGKNEAFKKKIVPEAFEVIGVKSLPIESFGARVQTSRKLRCSIRSGASDAAFDKLRELDYGDNLYTAIHHDRLNAIAKEIAAKYETEEVSFEDFFNDDAPRGSLEDDLPKDLFNLFREFNTSVVKI